MNILNFIDYKTIPDYYNIYLSTNTGNYRLDNQDSYLVYNKIKNKDIEKITILNKKNVFVSVFDGIGGGTDGKKCSEICARNFRTLYLNLEKSDYSEEYLNDNIDYYVSKSNCDIIDMLEKKDSPGGGSTFAMAAIIENRLIFYSLGDSRIYLYRNKKIKQLTVDHTMNLEKEKRSHRLLLYIGCDKNKYGLSPELYKPLSLRKNDKILICTDGIYDFLSDDEICKILSVKDEKYNYSQKLVDMSLENQSKDNLTACVISCNKMLRSVKNEKI